MSLFGTSPPEENAALLPATAAAKSRTSLFDDEAPSMSENSKSSLFADDDDGPGSSPWGVPAQKKPRGELIKSLLPASAVPDSYIDIFDNALEDGDEARGTVSLAGIAKVMLAAKLGDDDESKIMSIISPGGQFFPLGRNEFNVLLALIGLAQEHEEVTLDSVDERRKNLPTPKLPGLSSDKQTNIPFTSELAAKPPQRPATPPVVSEPALMSKPRSMPRKDSLEYPESDPWASPALHTTHNHAPSSPKVNGGSRDVRPRVQEPARTTSNFTTRSRDGSSGNSIRPSAQAAPTSGVWGSYDAPSPSFGEASPSAGDSGFGVTPGAGGGDGPTSNAPSRTIGGGRVTNGVEETVVISLLPEKEGMFMFQHHNYQVVCVRKGSKVVRRYSDFVWLLDCLQKRYPFRQLPLLPPKRVGVNGNHLAADSLFIEKRRRGLVRFSNALTRHPVLSQEQLVIMFLTVPTELSVWRKQATISVQEEFTGKPLPAGLEDSLPPSLNELFDTTRTGVRRSAEIYINLCNLMDRLSKRTDLLAQDSLRISLSLQSLTDASQDTYATDTSDVPLLNEGLHATAKHMSNSQSLLEDEARAWDQGVVEDLKRQRDALVSMRDMFDRRDRYDRDNIPTLERRIQSNEQKLVAIRSKPDGMIKPGEVEKVTEAIIKDKESIVAQHARGVFIKECIRDELIFFQQSQIHVSRLSRDYAQERVKYAELHADNWKQLHEELESNPLGAQ